VTVPRASQHPRESWVATYQSCCTTASESQHIKTQKGWAGKGCWHCRYPEDRVPPHASIKVRQRLPPLGWGQLRGRHVSPRLWLPLPARGSSGAATCPCGSGQHRGRHVPPRLGAAPGPPHVTWASAPNFWRRAAPELPSVTWALRASCK
jgi:hypothetical protein